MASAIAALRGEMKRFESGLACRAISPNKLKANRLSAWMSPVSAALRVRGRAVMGRGAVREFSPHWATIAPMEAASRGRTIDRMCNSWETDTQITSGTPLRGHNARSRSVGRLVLPDRHAGRRSRRRVSHPAGRAGSTGHGRDGLDRAARHGRGARSDERTHARRPPHDAHAAPAGQPGRFGPRRRARRRDARRGALAEMLRFDAAKPTSLLYRKESDGTFVLVGAMYAASGRTSLDQLDARVPLSVARWHEHVNWCVPPLGRRDRWRETREGRPVFGPKSPMATAAACSAVGGRFLPHIFGWMVHVMAFAGDDPHIIWGAGHEHAHS